MAQFVILTLPFNLYLLDEIKHQQTNKEVKKTTTTTHTHKNKKQKQTNDRSCDGTLKERFVNFVHQTSK